MNVVVVSASPRKNANTQLMMKCVLEHVKTKSVNARLIDLSEDWVECYKGPDEEYGENMKKAAADLMGADVWLVGTPIYNSFFSAALKNLFEYVDYKKTEGKVAGIAIMAAGNIGFTDVQTILTQLMSYFRIITNPKAVFLTTESVAGGAVSDDAEKRLREMVDGTLHLASKIRQN